MDEVDDFVARLLQTLVDDSTSHPRVTATEARNIIFGRAFGGYDPDAVDSALDDWAGQLPE